MYVHASMCLGLLFPPRLFNQAGLIYFSPFVLGEDTRREDSLVCSQSLSLPSERDGQKRSALSLSW